MADVYLPDLKLWDPDHCHRYLGVSDYPQVARDVVSAMHPQVGDLVVDEDGLALEGIMVRHLVMPGLADDAGAIARFLAGLSHDVYVNLMGQYHPAWKVTSTGRHEAINRVVTGAELEQARTARTRGWAVAAGLALAALLAPA